MKLTEVAREILPKKEPLTFQHNGKDYSDKIINVTFEYSSKAFNKLKKNTFVMSGYFLDELIFKDNIATIDGIIVGVITNVPTHQETSFDLPRGFSFEENENGTWNYVAKNIHVELTKKELREYLYENGFNCNGKHYVRFKRSSGSARVGKCLFIDERLYPPLHAWEMCGLDIQDGQSIDLAALESYISLPTSSAIDIIDIDPRNILIIPDYDSNVQEESIIVEMDDKNDICVREGVANISNSIFDGQSLIDMSIMGKYSCYGMMLLRNRFFKSCCFNTNLQQWFRDNNITNISQLHPESITFASRIEDIKLVTTPNSIKYIKFGSLTDWLTNIDSTFSVVKHDKKTHYFDGRMVQAHYQLLNTLQLSETEIKKLLNPSLEYVNYLNTDTDVLKYHIKCEIQDNEAEIDNVLTNKNEIVYKMLNISSDFANTKYFYDFKKETCKSYLKNLKMGHILIDGNYSVLFGNPYEMLLHTLGAFSGESSLPPGNIHTRRYPYGKKLLGCRSPHISTSNILITTNMKHDLIDIYFNLTPEIVCINAIKENILERLSGADFDSDQMIVTDNEILITAALRNYNVFKIPANLVKARKSQRYYTNENKADLDYKTSENKIGEIVNLSQELNTMMWEYINKSNKRLIDCYEDVKDLYYDICILNVLSCIEIDKAKKEFDISSDKEIRKIKKRWMEYTFDKKMIKPAFLGFIAQSKGYKNCARKKYVYHHTTMDFVLKILNKYKSSKSKPTEFFPLSKCFYFEGYNTNSVNRKQLKMIVSRCRETTKGIQFIWSREYYSSAEKHFLTEAYRTDLLHDIRKIKINPDTMYALVRYIDMPEYKDISKTLFGVLFGHKNDDLIELIINARAHATYLEEAPSGEIKLYDIPFKRIAHSYQAIES